MNRVIIIGAGGQAKVVADAVEKQGLYDIVGFVDNLKGVGDDFCGYKVLGCDDHLGQLLELYSGVYIVVAIGDNFSRERVVAKIAGDFPTVRFATVVHPSAQIARGVELGDGAVVMAGAVINSDSKIGAHCIVNSGASIDHDSVVGEFASIAPAVATGGGCVVGRGAAISIGAVIIRGIKVGSCTVIGAGAVVVKDCEPSSIYYGVPARWIRNRVENEKYL